MTNSPHLPGFMIGSNIRRATDGIRHHYEKAFDILDRRTLWNHLMRHYGVPEKIDNIIQNSYDELYCKVVHGGKMADPFQVGTSVKQNCLLSPYL